METTVLQAIIEQAWQAKATGSDQEPAHLDEALATILARLDDGTYRIASPSASDQWTVHAWLKQAILLCFRRTKPIPSQAGPLHFNDGWPLKSAHQQQGIRIVPPGAVRYGAFLEPGCVVMPGYVNVGAYVGAGTMVDTFATVGSCAQIGKGVHISGGVGIGGVLEPPQGRPVCIGDHAFLGSRAVLVEGITVGERAVIGAGVILTASTPIIDVRGPQEHSWKGHVPANAVIVPGVRQRAFASGSYGMPCALLIGERSAATDEKVSLNDTLRAFAVPV